MIKEVRYGIKDALYEKFGENYNIYIDKLEQGFENPCFFVSLVEWYTDELIMGRWKVHTQFNITFFPKNEDEPTDECLDAIQKIKECLHIIKLEDGTKIRGTDIEAKVIDGIVQFYVTYDFETIADISGTAMESFTERSNIDN